MTKNKPVILVTNDDGISAKGIRTLWETVKDFGEVIVIAPDSAQSGMGHAITIHNPLRLTHSDLFSKTEAYSCSGTPVDCIKLGIYEVLRQKPDLIVSGVNHGANTSTNVLYSGTMSAAVEGAMEGIPSIGFSLCSFESDADFTNSQQVIRSVVSEALNNGIPKGVCLNVNIPDVPAGELKGVRVCQQANAFWEDRFDKRYDQFNQPYYWLTGDFYDKDDQEGTDLYWIDRGYASVVPTQFDMTAYSVMNELKNWKI